MRRWQYKLSPVTVFNPQVFQCRALSETRVPTLIRLPPVASGAAGREARPEGGGVQPPRGIGGNPRAVVLRHVSDDGSLHEGPGGGLRGAGLYHDGPAAGIFFTFFLNSTTHKSDQGQTCVAINFLYDVLVAVQTTNLCRVWVAMFRTVVGWSHNTCTHQGADFNLRRSTITLTLAYSPSK